MATIYYKDLGPVVAKVQRQIFKGGTDVQHQAAKKGFERIVYRTPVLTGRHRGDWIISTYLGGSETGILDPDGADTVARGWAKIDTIKYGRRIYMINAGPWIEMLEVGWSKKAPQGMVKITVAELNQTYDAVATWQKAFDS